MGVLEQLQRFAVLTEAREQHAELDDLLDRHRAVGRAIGLEGLLRTRQQLRRRERTTGRARIGEHELREVAGKLRARRLILGEPSLLVRLEHLPEREAAGNDQRNGHDTRTGHRRPIPLHELRGDVAKRPRPRRYRLVCEVAPQILREQLGGPVAFAGIPAQRHRNDVVEIAAEAPPPLRLHSDVRQTRRIRLQGQPNQLRRSFRFVAGRPGTPAGEQLEQHGAECKHICRSGDRLAEQLLGRGIARREPWPDVARQRRDIVTAAGQQRGDAEIEQLHLALPGHEDVRRLEIAMDDEIAVGVRHGGQNVEEQPDALLDAETALVQYSSMRSPRTYSRTRYGWRSASTPASSSRAMFGCCKRASTRPSRANRCSDGCPTSAAFSSFTATCPSNRPSLRCASQTVPMPPNPSGRSSVYAPKARPSRPAGNWKRIGCFEELAGRQRPRPPAGRT